MTILGITLSAAIIWLIVAVVCGIIEALTLGLTTIWFTGGAVIASIAAMAGASVLVQVIAFLAVSALLLYFTRPLAKKKLKVGSEKTNVDALVGREAVIISAIPPMGTGQARVDGLVWTAASKESHQAIEAGTTVKIKGIEGVKLIVSPSDL